VRKYLSWCKPVRVSEWECWGRSLSGVAVCAHGGCLVCVVAQLERGGRPYVI
jgi:hypothetical protein